MYVQHEELARKIREKAKNSNNRIEKTKQNIFLPEGWSNLLNLLQAVMVIEFNSSWEEGPVMMLQHAPRMQQSVTE